MTIVVDKHGYVFAAAQSPGGVLLVRFREFGDVWRTVNGFIT
jgi:hypothetical protein